MTLRNTFTALSLLGLLVVSPGCKDFYDVNVDPLHPTKAEMHQLLPTTQAAMATGLGFNIEGLGQIASALVGQVANLRGFSGAFQQSGNSFNNQWTTLYESMLANNEQMITQGTTEQQWGYVGIAQIQKAFVFSQMVDMYGSLPYSEALKGAGNIAPHFDRDADIYNGTGNIQGLFALIDAGIANLSRGSSVFGNADLIYQGNLDKWKRMGYTLKLKLYNQIRNTRNVTPEVTALLAQSANLMQSAEDFEFQYGSSVQPENRNIGFLADYVNPSRENSIGVHFYNLMKTSYAGQADPRVPYYFFNQRTATPAAGSFDVIDGTFITSRIGSTGPASNAANANDRTVPGLYPYGGRFDDGRGVATGVDGSSGRGTGAQRLLTYFGRKFTEAELQLTVLNNSTAAATAYIEGIKASFDKVNAIALENGSPTIPADSNYIKKVGGTFIRTQPTSHSVTVEGEFKTQFNQASAEDKLRLIMEQKYIASFGMGIDIYTDFRRTHYPLIRVPGNEDPARGVVNDNDPQTNSTSAYPRRLLYSQQDITSNPNAPKTQPNASSDLIFWDR
jgi:hypothetical protein